MKLNHLVPDKVADGARSHEAGVRKCSKKSTLFQALFWALELNEKIFSPHKQALKSRIRWPAVPPPTPISEIQQSSSADLDCVPKKTHSHRLDFSICVDGVVSAETQRNSMTDPFRIGPYYRAYQSMGSIRTATLNVLNRAYETTRDLYPGASKECLELLNSRRGLAPSSSPPCFSRSHPVYLFFWIQTQEAQR
jgi:hypothetical protein